MTQQSTRKNMAAGLRLDPSLRQGRRVRNLVWTVTSVVALAILVTFFAIAERSDDSAQNQPASATTTGSSWR